MKRPAFLPIAAVILTGLIAIPLTLLSQSSNASIKGVVTDGSGATVAGADLTLRAIDSAALSKATSEADGVFSFANLPAGNYQVKVSGKGFKDFIPNGDRASSECNSTGLAPIGFILPNRRSKCKRIAFEF